VLKIAQWAILAKEPACHGTPSPAGCGGRVGKGINNNLTIYNGLIKKPIEILQKLKKSCFFVGN
jgi:hypothetical protein